MAGDVAGPVGPVDSVMLHQIRDLLVNEEPPVGFAAGLLFTTRIRPKDPQLADWILFLK